MGRLYPGHHMTLQILLLILASLFAAVAAAAQPAASPEDAIRALMRALYADDRAAYEAVTVPHPDRHRLVQGGAVNEEALRELEDDPGMLQIEQVQPFLHQGQPAAPDAEGRLPDGTTTRYMVSDGRSPMIVSLVQRSDGWKVDVRWWLKMIEMAEGMGFTPGTADYAARALTASLVQLDRASAARFVMPGADMELLFAAAPSHPEPSGHLDALVAEMPLVEIGPGEHAVLPTGRVVEGSDGEERRVLVGLLGVVEVPFVVRRVEGEWRVEAEPYFLVLNQ
jgi:hypothetical protein